MSESNSSPFIPLGFCQCGCGQRTNIAPQTSTKIGWIKGRPLRFVLGHRTSTPRYATEDRGYDTLCYIWQRCLNHDGYAFSSHGYEARRAYERRYGPMPSGHETHHRCEQRACVRPDHLLAVTHKENVRFQARVKLTQEKADLIRRIYEETALSYGKLAKTFGVSKPTIAKIITRRTWNI